MEQHPVPRQITTFEFKLIGFMTLKQFLYLLIFIPSAFIVWKIIPIPLLNIALAAVCALFGFALAFAPINDRPMDVWIRNFIKRLTSPTQYTYGKNNRPLYFLDDLYFLADPHRVVSHIESKEKLAAYLAKTAPVPAQGTQKQSVQTLLQTPTHDLNGVKQSANPPVPQAVQVPMEVQQPVSPQEVKPQVAVQPSPAPLAPPAKRPFLIGVVKNNKRLPLPGILIYFKDANNAPLRLLKTNPHGVFATYNVLQPGEYTVELKDPKGGYFFDTMKVKVEASNPNPLEFYSKEML